MALRAAIGVTHRGLMPGFSVQWGGMPVSFSESEPFQQGAGPDRGRGALWGAGIGLVAGGLLGGLTVESDADDGFGGGLVESAATGTAVALGALTGAAIGALSGATVFAPSGGAQAFSNGGDPARLVPVIGPEAVGLRYRVR